MSNSTPGHIHTAQSAPQPIWIATHLPHTVAVLVTLLITTIRVWFGRHVTFCGTPDSCAYLSLGESLSHHQGFTQRFLYQYQFVSTHLPSHGIEYWRPGTSLLLLLAQPFGGVNLHSSIVVTNLAAIVLSLAAWKIAVDATGNRRIACASYLLCLVLPTVWTSSITPDSSIFYGAFAAWFLALLTVRFSSYTADAIAILCVAGVNLVRNDAILLFLPLVVVLWLRYRSAQPRGASARYAALIVVCFFAAMLPITLLQHAVLGKLSAGSTSHVLYLTSLSDLGRYGGPPLTLHTFLTSGIGKLIKLRVTTLPAIAYHFLFLQIGFSILFLAAWRNNAKPSLALPETTGGLSFVVVLLAMYSLVLPAIGGFSALRSLTALLPLIAVVIVVCIYTASESPTTAATLASMTILLYIVFGVSQDRRDQTELNKTGTEDRLVATWLASHGADPSRSLIMTKDAAQFSVTTGYAAIPVPSNGLLATKAAATDLGANFILLDASDLAPGPTSVQSTLHATQVNDIPGTSTYVFTIPSPLH
jgi:hypothetical protein